MNITVKIVPRDEQRLCVDGCDWFWEPNGDLQVRVSPLSDWRRETLLALHEVVEAVLCKHQGVSQESVDKFDIEFDKSHPNEPDLGAGDSPLAPYARQHHFALAVESILCNELNVDWTDYNRELGQTYPGISKRK